MSETETQPKLDLGSRAAVFVTRRSFPPVFTVGST